MLDFWGVQVTWVTQVTKQKFVEFIFRVFVTNNSVVWGPRWIFVICAMVIPPLIGILIMGIYKPLLLGWWPSPIIWNNGSLDPGAFEKKKQHFNGHLQLLQFLHLTPDFGATCPEYLTRSLAFAVWGDQPYRFGGTYGSWYPAKLNIDTQHGHIWEEILFPSHHFGYLC